MIRKLQTIKSYVYVTIGLLFCFILFCFMSFGIDSEAVVSGYKDSFSQVKKEETIVTLRAEVENIQDTQNNDTSYSVDNFLETARKNFLFLYQNNYGYSTSLFDVPVDANIYKATNCGHYVQWVLQCCGNMSNVPYTSARGIAKWCLDQGWEVNESYDNIKPGDIVWCNRPGSNELSLAKLKNGTGSGLSHLAISLNPEEETFFDAGNVNSWMNNQGKPRAIPSIKNRFICSFRYGGDK